MLNPIKIIVILVSIVFLLFPFSSFSQCHLVIINNTDFDSNLIENQIHLLFNKFLEPVIPMPIEGLKNSDCLYRTTFNQSRDDITVLTTGPRFNSDGSDSIVSIEGVKNSFLKSIYSSYPEKRNTICSSYKNSIPYTCGILTKNHLNLKQTDTDPPIIRTYTKPRTPSVSKPEPRNFEQHPPPNDRRPPPNNRLNRACRHDINTFCDGHFNPRCLLKHRNQLKKRCLKVLRQKRRR